MANETRNADICRLYTEGQTLKQLAGGFALSVERVRQIVKKANLTKKDRKVIRTDRDTFLGVNIRPATKLALETEAQERGMSVSALVSEKLEAAVA